MSLVWDREKAHGPTIQALYAKKNMSNWIEKVDFAFVAKDSVGQLALLYVEGKFAPSIAKEKFTDKSYNSITSFIIDDLGNNNGDWPESDSTRGLYVF